MEFDTQQLKSLRKALLSPAQWREVRSAEDRLGLNTVGASYEEYVQEGRGG